MAPTWTQFSFEKDWCKVEPVVEKFIQNDVVFLNEWQDLYTDVHNICIWDPHGTTKIIAALESQLRPGLEQRRNELLADENNVSRLEKYILAWFEYKKHCERFVIAFLPVDLAAKGQLNHCSTTIDPTKRRKDSFVRINLLRLWDSIIISAVNKCLQNTARSLLERERQNGESCAKLIIGLKESYIQLTDVLCTSCVNTYLADFEKAYLIDSRTYYQTKASEQLKLQNPIDYIGWALLESEKEDQRAHMYLGHSPSIVQQANRACIEILVSNPRCAGLLASYCDLLLRKTSLAKKMSPLEIDRLLDRMIAFVAFLKDKDDFVKHYKIHLARRLILNTSINTKIEEEFVHKLRVIVGVGSEFSYDLVRMFKDLRSSSEIQTSFHEILQSSCPDEVNINNNNTVQSCTSRMAASLSLNDNQEKVRPQVHDVIQFQVFNSRAWTNVRDESLVNLPDDITTLLARYETFYTSKYPERKLEWCHQLSTAILTFTSNQGIYDLNVTVPQYAILSSFRGQPNEWKSLSQLKESTGLSYNDAKRTMATLVLNPKLSNQVMLSEPPVNSSSDLENSGLKFSINFNFHLSKNGKVLPKGRVNLIYKLQI